MRVKFGDVVKDIKANVNREEYEYYIAGDHMDSDDVHIRRRGFLSDGLTGSAFTRLFKTGQILYGSRRTYLKKCAVADFEGICSNTTFVLESADNAVFLNELLPFIILSDRFTEHSIKKSRGSVNPYVLFSDIAEFEFELPTIDEQRRLTEVLWAFDEAKQAYKKLLKLTDELVKSQFVEMFGDPVTNPMEWCVKPLGKCGSLKNGINYTQRDSGYTVRCLGVGDFRSLYRIDDIYRISEISLSSQPAQDYLLQDDDIVFVRSNGNRALVGRSVAVFPGEEELTFSGFCIRYRNESTEVLTVYLNHALHLPTMKAALLSDGRGANIQNVNQQALSSLRIPIPPLQLQNRFADFVRQADKSKFNVSLRVLSGFCGLNGHVGIKWA